MDCPLGCKLLNVGITRASGDVLWSLARESKTTAETLFNGSVFDVFGNVRELVEFRNGMASTLFRARQKFEINATLKSGKNVRVKTTWVEAIGGFVVVFCDCQGVKQLSPKQLEIVNLMKRDKTITEISQTLGIAESTVQSHLAALRAKFRVKTNYGLISAL